MLLQRGQLKEAEECVRCCDEVHFISGEYLSAPSAKLLGTSATLVVTGALLVVTRSY